MVEMDFSNRGGRPTPTQQPAQAAENNAQPAMKSGGSSKSSMSFGKTSSMVLLISVAAIVFTLILGLVFVNSDVRKESSLIIKDDYQAVFLDSQDGQVYFGKLAVYSESLYMLTDIYYVRVENPIQPQGTEAQQPNISLAKLGNELHGPQDMMFISRDKVLYWENLKDDGQVVTAITEFKASGAQTPATQQTAPQTTQPAGTPQEDDTPAETPVETPAAQ